jgi:hypothetical protein
MNPAVAIMMANQFPQIRQMVQAYIEGDQLAVMAIVDFLQERGVVFSSNEE